jgi:FkbM family methyltransferase
MPLGSWVKSLVPDRWQVPARYHYRRVRGVLERELPFALSYVRPGSVVVDVGAHDGTYSYALESRAGRVEAFEPLPWCARMLDAHAKARSGLRVHNVALSDVRGESVLRIPVKAGVERQTEATLSPRGIDGRTRELRIRVETLDSFDLGDVSLVKIDVEGHELAVLRGARETLARERPVLLIEIEQRHITEDDIRVVFDEVAAYGFSGWFVGGDGDLRSIDSFDPARHQRLEENGEPGAGYVNNFFWLPAGH